MEILGSTAGHQGAVGSHGCKPAVLEGRPETGAALTCVGVSLLRSGRTGSEGELALHGRLGFALLPQNFAPIQLRSLGEGGYLIFALEYKESFSFEIYQLQQ